MKNVIGKIDRGACPSEINLNRYILHSCSNEERKGIEDHLLKCPLCRMEVVSFMQVQSEIQEDEKLDELPESIYKKSMSFIKKISGPQESRLDIVLRFIHEQWELIRFTGTLVPRPALAALRGNNDEEEGSISTVIKEFGEYRAEVDLKKGAQEDIDLQIRIKRVQEESLLPHVTFTLRDMKKQRLLEESTKDGDISFERLKLGEYSIEIVRQGDLIGSIFLDLSK